MATSPTILLSCNRQQITIFKIMNFRRSSFVVSLIFIYFCTNLVQSSHRLQFFVNQQDHETSRYVTVTGNAPVSCPLHLHFSFASTRSFRGPNRLDITCRQRENQHIQSVRVNPRAIECMGFH